MSQQYKPDNWLFYTSGGIWFSKKIGKKDIGDGTDSQSAI